MLAQSMLIRKSGSAGIALNGQNVQKSTKDGARAGLEVTAAHHSDKS
jgi:hypothetical protein